MLTLYGSAGSGSAAVEMALERCALPYRVLRASSWEADSAQAALRQANPLGQIPTLQLEDGSVLTESAAILIHLGLTHPGSNLLPAAPAARAQALRGLVYIAANCYAAIGVIDFPQRWCVQGEEAQLDGIRQGARRRLHECWTVFADQFGAQLFQPGEGPVALDFLAVVVSRWSGARAHLAEHRPELAATLDRIQSHPTVAPVWARHWPT